MKTKTSLAILTAAAIIYSAAPLRAADPPGIMNHQGRLAVSGTNYDGTGYIKFALVTGDPVTETFWTNDGTNTGTPGGEPTAAVTVTVTKGHYAIGLGEIDIPNNMTNAIPASVFADHADVHLRLWFSTDNVTFELLSPDRRITSAGYALSAARAGEVAMGGITTAMLADGAVTIPKISPTYFVGESGDGSGTLDLAGTPGQVAYDVSFDLPFAPGIVPEITLPEGWTLDSPASESGFTAVRAFAPVTVDGADEVGTYSSLKVINGRPSVSYYDTTNGSLQFAIAGDATGSSWGAPVTADSGGSNTVGQFTSLARIDGRPAISYYDSTSDDLKYVIADDADGTSWGTPVTVDSAGNTGRFTSLANVNGRPAISYFYANSGDLKYAIANDLTGASWGAPVTVDSTGSVGAYSSLWVVYGRPAISYYDSTSDDLKFAIADDSLGTGTWTVTTVDTAGNVGRFTSLAVIDGRPAISYDNAGTFDLKYAIAGDAEGTSWPAGNIQTLDSAGTVGLYTSLEKIDGRPVISYYDSTNRDLKLALSDTTDGTGTWTLVTVDGPDNVGEHTSLASVDGRPAVSYYDASNKDVKYIRLPATPDWTAASGEAHPLVARTARTVESATSAAPAYYQMQWADLPATDISLTPGGGGLGVTATVEFDRPFLSPPDIEETGWSVWGLSETGFNANKTVIFEPREVDSGFGVDLYTSLAVVDGRPAISYHDPGRGQLKFAIAHIPGGNGWGEPVVVDSGPSTGRHTSLAVVNSRPAISYFAAGEVRYVRADDANGDSWGTPVTLDTGLGITGGHTSLAVVNGHPAVCYNHPLTSQLRFVIADDADGTTWGTPVTVQNASNGGWYPSLAIVDGRPAISVYIDGPDFLLYAIAGDADGATWPAGNVVVVDSGGAGGDVGFYSSLAVVNGKPAISYRDLANLDLKYAFANDATGTTGWTTLTVDSFGDAGRYTSLAVIDGKPAISYYGSGDLRFAISPDPDGWGPWTTVPADWNGTAGYWTSLAEVRGLPAISYYANGGLSYATIPMEGRWTASDPGQETVLAARATGVVDGSITNASLTDDVVTTNEIVDGSITADDLDTDTIGLWNASGFDVYRIFGSVGIGTSTPTAKLSVTGSAYIGGNLGIGTTSPTAKLSVDGDANNTTGVWGIFSDRRLKENIAPMQSGSLEQLLRLEGMTYDYTSDEFRTSYPHAHRGWIAQDVEQVFPEWVSEAPDGMKMVTPVGYRALVVEALRELKAEKDAAVAELEKENVELRRRLEQLEEILETLLQNQQVSPRTKETKTPDKSLP